MNQPKEQGLIVVKYGGKSLADEEKIARAARAIAKEVERGARIAVVVSAMGRTTDQLLYLASHSSGGKVNKMELDDILAMGERTSIRIITEALKAQGVQSRYFDPLDRDWPIITDGAFSNANPVLEQCEQRIQQYVAPLIESGVVPVIAGFVGRTVDGKVTTLGRGGSDTTAFILARVLGANEVVLVTDSDGIMSADPKIINYPRRLTNIDVGALVELADSGTKFIHRKALKHKDPSIPVRVISYSHGDLITEGTLITGGLSNDSNLIEASQHQVCSVTIVGHDMFDQPTIIQELIENVTNHSPLIGTSSDHDSMTMYVSGDGNLDPLLSGVHEVVLRHKETTAMSVRKGLALLKVNGIGLEKTPEIIGEVAEVLRLNKINIFGLLTIASSILLFVDWGESEKVRKLIKESLGGQSPC